MKSLSRIIFFSILLFLFISCKKNENKDFTAAAIDIENSQREELLTVEEVKERLDLKNPEVKEYFKPFYESLKILDVENPTVEDQIKLFYETIKVLDREYYFNIFDFDYKPSDELTEIFHKIFSISKNQLFVLIADTSFFSQPFENLVNCFTGCSS